VYDIDLLAVISMHIRAPDCRLPSREVVLLGPLILFNRRLDLSIHTRSAR
jgi:hypothetical protein